MVLYRAHDKYWTDQITLNAVVAAHSDVVVRTQKAPEVGVIVKGALDTEINQFDSPLCWTARLGQCNLHRRRLPDQKTSRRPVKDGRSLDCSF